MHKRVSAYASAFNSAPQKVSCKECLQVSSLLVTLAKCSSVMEAEMSCKKQRKICDPGERWWYTRCRTNSHNASSLIHKLAERRSICFQNALHPYDAARCNAWKSVSHIYSWEPKHATNPFYTSPQAPRPPPAIALPPPLPTALPPRSQ